eukprot:TRINITY_DN6749_c0_g1_i1.p1 TRINITY_DN6749_c0_g1~~TRINITY_DN6749_c0_g1_i1.p1  ORF type:complete len:278 (-),score=-6.29 TRINITY_DN6749_c0_g1_i1:124-957(-)
MTTFLTPLVSPSQTLAWGLQRCANLSQPNDGVLGRIVQARAEDRCKRNTNRNTDEEHIARREKIQFLDNDPITWLLLCEENQHGASTCTLDSPISVPWCSPSCRKGQRSESWCYLYCGNEECTHSMCCTCAMGFYMDLYTSDDLSISPADLKKIRSELGSSDDAPLNQVGACKIKGDCPWICPCCIEKDIVKERMANLDSNSGGNSQRLTKRQLESMANVSPSAFLDWVRAKQKPTATLLAGRGSENIDSDRVSTRLLLGWLGVSTSTDGDTPAVSD